MPSSARGRMTFCSRLTIGTPERFHSYTLSNCCFTPFSSHDQVKH